MEKEKVPHISVSLSHGQIETANSILVVPAICIINDGVNNLTRLYQSYGHDITPHERIAFVQGMKAMAGFMLAQAKLKLREEYANTSFGDEPFPDTSSARLAEVAVSMIQPALGFYQAARYISAVAVTDSDADLTPELTIAKDDAVLENLYKALKREIPEFLMGMDGSNTVH